MQKLKVMPITGYILFLFTGLVIFFFGAFLVILLRTKNPSKIIMPDLIGKNYIEVHNELVRLGFKVHIQNKRFLDKNDGSILSQSITPGKSTERGSKITLVVNIGVDRVTIPDLRGQSLSNARANLEKVLSGETYVSIPLGEITYIEAKEGQFPETVIDQIPKPGKETTTREKIYLLVTEPKGYKNPVDNFKSLQGKPVSFATEKLKRKNLSWKISDIVSTKSKSESGLVESIEKKDNRYNLKVFFFPVSQRIESGYESISYKIDAPNEYKVVEVAEDQKGKKEEEILPLAFYAKNEELKLVYYRNGNSKLTIYAKDGDKEKSYSFESDL
ncbi:MAG: PASTA domain-containing protein [Leptospiraceae bacterium]|nr:PASTA domain-containing protein [Leptospiraceae bacterium]